MSMVAERQILINLYENYGFEYRQDFEELEILVFTITQGVFDNAIIIKLNNEYNSTKIEKDLKDLGFHVKVEVMGSLYAIESELFQGFFSVKKQRLSSKRIMINTLVI